MSTGGSRYAVLQPYAASWLLATLRDAKVGGAQVRAHSQKLREHFRRPDLAAQLEEAFAELRAADASNSMTNLAPATSVDGSAEVVVAEVEAGLGVSGEMTTQEAADMLHITPRWVGQKLVSGELSGRKVGRAWAVDRASVVALRDLRRAT